jgi:hypothetical protein
MFPSAGQSGGRCSCRRVCHTESHPGARQATSQVAESARLPVRGPHGRQSHRVKDTNTFPGAHSWPFAHCSG